MNAQLVFKGVVIPAASAIAIAEGHTLGPHCSKKQECLCKPSELPIYQNDCAACQTKAPEKQPSELEATVGKIRKEVWVWQDQLHGYRQRVVDSYNTGVAHASSSLDFLREESHEPERYGAIALSSLSGYILGLRGGKFKRLTYATVGGVAMAALCYPRLAAEYSDVAVQQGTQYATTGYHFLFGEKPKAPEWLSSIIGQTKQLYLIRDCSPNFRTQPLILPPSEQAIISLQVFFTHSKMISSSIVTMVRDRARLEKNCALMQPLFEDLSCVGKMIEINVRKGKHIFPMEAVFSAAVP